MFSKQPAKFQHNAPSTNRLCCTAVTGKTSASGGVKCVDSLNPQNGNFASLQRPKGNIVIFESQSQFAKLFVYLLPHGYLFAVWPRSNSQINQAKLPSIF